MGIMKGWKGLRGFYKFAAVLVKPFYRIFFRFKISGLEHIPPEGGVILCANHTSYHDTLALAVACPRQMGFLAKRELFKGRISTKVLSSLGGIPLNREKPGLDTLKTMVSLLKGGKAMGIFIQGTRRQELVASDYKAGAALFAVKARVPVVPVYIGSKFRLFSKIVLNIGPPISFEEFWDKKIKMEEFDILASQIMDKIIELGGQE